MNLELRPYDLAWTDVDPRTHAFDHADALDMVRALEPASRVPVRPVQKRTSEPVEAAEQYRTLCHWSHNEGWAWADDMTEALVERYGRWSTGWRWAHDEGDLGGGPVGAWCCTLHSIGTPEETLERVAAALCEWREWLEFLADWFARYPLEGPPATHRLILQVVDRTGSGDAWYAHCRQVLTWYLTRWDTDPTTARALVEEAIGGRFESWTMPAGKLLDDVSEQLAVALGAEEPADPSGTYTYTSARIQSHLDE
ncbi:hypothetical protein [Streptomyces sp. NPDC088794]|uniref:hypothetical protein n=1 Tax=Streptomyces sp. NPDC088794 TaxID=3365902 RepID=UPI0038254E69